MWVNLNFGVVSVTPNLDPKTVTTVLPFLGALAGLTSLVMGTKYDNLRVNELIIAELLAETKRKDDVPTELLEIIDE